MLILLQNPARAVAAIFFLSGAFFGAWASRIPSFKAIFYLNADDLGLLLLLLAVGAIVSFPLTGEAINRYGAVKTTRIVSWSYGISLILLGFAPSIFTLALAIFVFGFFHGSMDVAMNAWGAEVERRIKQTILPLLHAVFSLGAGSGALFGSWAILNQMSVQFHFLLFAAITTLFCMILATISWQSAISENKNAIRVFTLPKGGLVLVGIIAFCASVGEGGMADWSAIFLVDAIGTSESFAALGYAIFSTTMVITRIFGSWLVARLGPVISVRASGIMAFAGLIIAIIAPNAYLALLGFGVLGVGYALIIPLAFSRAANDPTQEAGTAIAGMATLGYGGLLLGPPIIGYLAAIFSLKIAFTFIALLAAVIIFSARALKGA